MTITLLKPMTSKQKEFASTSVTTSITRSLPRTRTPWQWVNVTASVTDWRTSAAHPSQPKTPQAWK